MFLPVVRSDRMEPRSRWTRYPDTRDEAFEYFRNKGFQARRVQSLCNIAYPKFTRTVVSEISSAKAVGFDLVLLCFLPTIAAAERGKHRVVLSDGRKNSLSCIFFVGAESGAGKGLALEESLAFFSHWEEAEIQKIQAENARRTDENDLIKARIKVLRKQYAKKPTVETKNLILAEKSKLKDMLPFPHLLQNDVTAASYTQELVKHNIAIRLESDGIILPDSTMRIVNKAWSGENSRRTRISMPDGVFREPFIVDFVAIQPDFFHRYISDPKAVESGRLARTLVYLYDANSFTPNQPAHEMEQQIRNIFHGKLEDLLHYSETSSEKTSILLDPEAESLFFDIERAWHDQCKPGGSLYRIKDFGERMAQYALRLAGILHLAENEVGSQTNITAETMQIAIDMIEVFADHTFAYRIKGYGEFNQKCCCDVMTYILEENLYRVPETLLKQSLKNLYKADDIKIALYYLQQSGHLYQDYQDILYGKRVGRPVGRIFVNPYHDRYGRRL